jgi:parallel beta-helix repeat protein
MFDRLKHLHLGSAAMALVLVHGSAVLGATIRVARDGGGDYTVIQDAVNAAASGDTISIGPGEYVEEAPFLQDCCNETSTNVGVFQDTLWLIGDSAEEVVIGPAQTSTGIAIAMREGSANELHVRGVTIRNQFAGIRLFGRSTVSNIVSLGVGLGVDSFAESLTIQESVFLDSRQAGVALLSGSQNSFVLDCEFRRGLVGVDLFDSRDARIAGNTFTDCEIGINVGDWSNPVIVGNVIDCAISYGIGLVHDSSATLLDNTVCGGFAAIGMIHPADAVIRSNRLIGGSNAVVYMRTACDVQFENNSLLRRGEHSVCLRGYAAPAECNVIDMSNNYWFTTDTDSIQSWIYDGLADPDIDATVQFIPILQNQPVGLTPMSAGGLKALFSHDEKP